MRWLLISLFLFLLSASTSAQEFNAGFVQGLWFADETIFAEDPTRIYVAVRNNTGADLSGTVEFFVDDKKIERKNVDVLDGRIVESWADWTPPFGTSTIRATLSRTEISSTAEGTQAIELTSVLAESVVFVDEDFDGDGVGNKTDKDDDNDGVSDEEEIENDTDPLDANDPSPEETEEAEAEAEEEDSEVTDELEEDVEDSSSDPEGLEQYLAEGRTSETLSSVTTVINNTKRNLDAYRSKRNERRDFSQGNNATESEDEADGSPGDPSASFTATSSDTTTESANTLTSTETVTDGFGEVSRTQGEVKGGWSTKLINLVKVGVSNGYTLVLFVASLYLTHPIIVQLSLLFLILFLIYKLARRLGQRQLD